uniref:Chemokine interleukin-8-like domain-containing protein n=1 Tax=Dicentrarchus labrax TaxID=13489 RepID=A0A8C4D6D6_DICLA
MAKVAVCVSIMVLLVALGESSKFCCTQYHEHPVPVKVLKSYQIQKDTGFCNIKAVIFRTAKKKLLCADPDKKWVKDQRGDHLRKSASRHKDTQDELNAFFLRSINRIFLYHFKFIV